MSSATQAPGLLRDRLKQFSDNDAMLGIGVVIILSIMLLPFPGSVLDILLAVNISIGLVILLTSIYTVKAVDFVIFPSLLLITTLFRLALNVASTRLILLDGHQGTTAAGKIISSFGQFVVGGNYVVGLVIFIILVIVNFVVITKGTERISEVAARFTLDAMPGKQMSIDADLNTGLINDQEARQRRAAIAQEADFYGAMDGASKFVRGDAIAGILITVINILGGFAIGMLQNRMTIVDALKNYTLLTVGDGLVSQIPALIISTAAGILVSKAASADLGMGRAFGNLFSLQPRPMIIAGSMLCSLGIIPGFPLFPFMLVGGALVGVSVLLLKKQTTSAEQYCEVEMPVESQDGSHKLPPLQEVLELEVGYGLIPLVDDSQDGDLLARIKAIRQQLALDFGIIVPALHVRDNLQLRPSEYRLLLKGNAVAKGELMLGHYLALSSGDVTEDLGGIATKDPAFGLPAIWIPEGKREQALRSGCTVIDLSTVVATHLAEIFKKHADELVDRQITQQLLDHLASVHPKLVDELTPNLLPIGTIQKVLQNLVREHVSIRDLQTICETLADHAPVTKDPEFLTELVRQSLARTITRPYETETGKLYVLTFQPGLEEHLTKNIQKTDHGAFLSLEPGLVRQLIQSVNTEMKKIVNLGHQPVVLCSPSVRRHLRKLLERFLPEVAVISHNELRGSLEIQSTGIIKVNHAN
ncbi:flagellar biosynthesis protein FlhA [Desulfoferrobacter suflitae]|uniref:flagellar biosynthesis protein FlhA n=1 Tax=Desulfoferrobacter suflitae TaxID=2865782 RepID=UPI0021641BF7|nr:flagellar biosynthesis protein FlhA [Desulfoferrobacter suflitae]MCK8602424.1 flagellar biosynthesis protein FlhA [Desulfoferrobacter suflitae]